MSLHLETPPGTSISLSITSWSDTAVMFNVPSAVPGGIPLYADGRLTLQRSDVAANGVHCGVTIGAQFEPPVMFLHASRNASDSRVNLNPFAGAYSKDHTLTSPMLPPRAEPLLTRVNEGGSSNYALHASFTVMQPAGDAVPPGWAVG